MKIHTIDLDFLGNSEAIAAFLVETSAGVVLVESGPYSTFQTLKNKIEVLGFEIADIRHLFLSHIHFDHAGAAWALAANGAKVYVHPFGAGHLANPQKLTDSARKIYLDQMDILWGDMKNIDDSLIHATADEEVIKIGDAHFKSWHTPGHANHHIAWQLEDVVFAGDVAGVSIGGGPVVPPCPPPDIHIDKWKYSISLLKKINARALYLTHFGISPFSTEEHFSQLEGTLLEYADLIKTLMKEGKNISEMTTAFNAYVNMQFSKYQFDEKQEARYQAANPAFMSVTGLMRYWSKEAGDLLTQ